MSRIRALSEYLQELDDPRKTKGLRHPLTAILMLCCVALMSGAKNKKQMANWWGRTKIGNRKKVDGAINKNQTIFSI